MAQMKYQSPGAGHYLKSLSRSGDLLLLEDRSTWQLEPMDTARVRRWSEWERITVVEAAGSAYWLVAQCNGREERVMAGFAGFLSGRTDQTPEIKVIALARAR